MSSFVAPRCFPLCCVKLFGKVRTVLCEILDRYLDSFSDLLTEIEMLPGVFVDPSASLNFPPPDDESSFQAQCFRLVTSWKHPVPVCVPAPTEKLRHG